MFWLGFAIGAAAFGLPFGLFCWIKGDWLGYDRAQREEAEARRKPPMRFPRILAGDD